MHQVRKGNQWYFGMKAHVGVDAETKLIHSVAATAANVSDCRMLPALLHGEEEAVCHPGVGRSGLSEPGRGAGQTCSEG